MPGYALFNSQFQPPLAFGVSLFSGVPRSGNVLYDFYFVGLIRVKQTVATVAL